MNEVICMCYFLYGAINNGINISDYEEAVKDYEYDFKIGKPQDVNDCVEKCGGDYRITRGHCDCNTPLGDEDPDHIGIAEFHEMLLKLQQVRGIKHILLSKNWWEESNLTEKTTHINAVDMPAFLANMKDRCLYKIELYPWHY